MPFESATARTALGHQDPVPLAAPTTGLFVNLSRVGGTVYPAAYVDINNSTTLYKLPYNGHSTTLSGPFWVTLVNLTGIINKAPLAQFQFENWTSANESGTVKSVTAGVKVAGGGAVWVSFSAWYYTAYKWTIAAPNYGTSAPSTAPTINLVNVTNSGSKQKWLNTTTSFSAAGVVTLTIPSNATFTVQLPTSFNGVSSNPSYGTTVTPVYTFSTQVRATPSALTHKYANLTVVGNGTEGWTNWTVAYTESNTTATSSGGLFYSWVLEFLDSFLTYWYLWLIAVFAIAFVAIAYSRTSRRQQRER
jgi:hypothetical protein